MGLPLLNGFIGEFMILQGAFAANRVWAYWAVSGVVLGAAYLLWLYQRVFWGKITNEENEHLAGPERPRAGDAACRSWPSASGSASTRSRSSTSCTCRSLGSRRRSSPGSSGPKRFTRPLRARWRRLRYSGSRSRRSCRCTSGGPDDAGR